MKKYLSSLLGKNIVAIDIGSYAIKIVEGSYNLNTVQINKMITIPTPSDAFYDGQIINKEKVKEAINIILKKQNIKTKTVTFTLESTNIINREIVLPWTKPQELKQIIEFETEQYLPIEIDKYILQYKIIDEFMETKVKKIIALIVALPKVISENYLALAKEMELNPGYLDIHSNVVDKLLPLKTVVNNSYPLEDQTIAVIDLGYKFINVIIVSKGKFKFSRLLSNGGKDIDINIANSFNLSLEEAQNKKMGIKNINYTTSQEASLMLIDVVKDTVSDWLKEIDKIFRYYTTRNTSNAIDSICIYGGSSNIEGMSTYIQQFFNIPTFKINSLANIKFNNDLNRIDISRYVNAIGAIIRI